MKIPWYRVLSLTLIVLFALVLNGVQCSLWYLLFGHFPPPLNWLIVLAYISVTRNVWEATLLTYLLTFVNASFTAFSFEALLVYSLALMGSLMLIRERVFWGGATFFMLMVSSATVLAPIFFWLASRWFDKSPLFLPNIFDWMISGLISILFALPIYQIFQWIDKIQTRDMGIEGHLGPR